MYKWNILNIKIKLLNDIAKIPTRAHDTDAGSDLYAAIEAPVVIPPHQTVKIGTGIAIEILDGMFGGVFARSGLATKKGLRPSNCVGVIDSSYRGEIIVALHNDSDEPQIVEPGERIAQLVILPYVAPSFKVADELDDTERGDSGFGDSGKF